MIEIVIIREQFEDWILSQQDETPLSFGGFSSRHNCHCPMVKYWLDTFEVEPSKEFRCNHNGWFFDGFTGNVRFAKFEWGMLYEDYGTAHRNYGELKRAVLKRREIESKMEQLS